MDPSRPDAITPISDPISHSQRHSQIPSQIGVLHPLVDVAPGTLSGLIGVWVRVVRGWLWRSHGNIIPDGRPPRVGSLIFAGGCSGEIFQMLKIWPSRSGQPSPYGKP